MKPKSKILIIAGSDSSGGAGIQADIKTVTALGSYAMTAITAITAQNTTGVSSVIPLHPKEIEKQILFTSKDINKLLKFFIWPSSKWVAMTWRAALFNLFPLIKPLRLPIIFCDKLKSCALGALSLIQVCSNAWAAVNLCAGSFLSLIFILNWIYISIEFKYCRYKINLIKIIITFLL